MNKIIFGSLVLIFFFTFCNLSEKKINLNDPLEAGREFIEASLKGNYPHAKKYLLEDSANIDYFKRMEEFNKKLSAQEKEGYKNANILIDSVENISDSVIIINYSNTFKNIPAKIKMVRWNNEWFVDFKYPFSGH